MGALAWVLRKHEKFVDSVAMWRMRGDIKTNLLKEYKNPTYVGNPSVR